jgi:hypothetical protein
MEKYEGVKEYFWRAELQKNGNIHFHLFIDRYVERKNIFKIWFNCMDDLGYIKPYEERFNNRTPPCVDVRGIKNAFSVTAYLLKYVSKNKKTGNDSNSTLSSSTVFTKQNSTNIDVSTKEKEYTCRTIVSGRIFGMSDSIKTYKPLKVSHIEYQANTMLSDEQKEQIYLYQDIAENPLFKHYSNEKGIEKHYYKPLKKGDPPSLTDYIKARYPNLYLSIKSHYINSYDTAHKPKNVTLTKKEKKENKSKSMEEILENIPTFVLPSRSLGSSPKRCIIQLSIFGAG